MSPLRAAINLEGCVLGGGGGGGLRCGCLVCGVGARPGAQVASRPRPRPRRGECWAGAAPQGTMASMECQKKLQ